MSKLILSLDDENTSLFSKQYLSLPELHEEIEKRLEDLKTMDKRKKKQLMQAKEDVNFFIDMYNAKAKFKTYNKVKWAYVPHVEQDVKDLTVSGINLGRNCPVKWAKNLTNLKM